MPTLQGKIAEAFLAKLAESNDFDHGKIEQLKKVLASSKNPKAEDFVKIFSQPVGGDLK